jgi:putative endonuclease
MANHLDFGRRGEQAAVDYLKNEGWSINTRNYKTKLGELDVIATLEPDEDLNVLAFVEVKTRGHDSGIPPERSVGKNKRQRIVRLGKYYINDHDVDGYVIRFDVIAVRLTDAEASITHYPGAFDASGRISP